MPISFKVGDRAVGPEHPTYFIADIAANHDGSLERAKELCSLAHESGADAAKFQHFRAPKIVSDRGFRAHSGDASHQSKWKKSVYEVYADASVPWEWTAELRTYCNSIGITFFSAPYDIDAIDMLDAHVPAYKVGSGDITWHAAIRRMAEKGKPVFLATGASTMDEVRCAVRAVLDINPQLCLMQCNTNYTGSVENFRHVQLNVLTRFAREFPDVVLGLSDHTLGCTAVLGAVALGARAVEKHFTHSRSAAGPDHGFSMEPADWREMVDRTRELEQALGSDVKQVEANERETVLLQRRCLRAAADLGPGHVLREADVDILRPVTPGAYLPNDLNTVVGRRIGRPAQRGAPLTPDLFV